MFSKRSMKLGVAGVALVAMIGTVPAVVPAHAAPGTGQGIGQVAESTIPVTGTLENGGTFAGSLSDLTAQVVDNELTLTGTITGTATDAGGVGTLINDTFTATIDNLVPSQSCTVLDLDLGPLHLDLLGLVIDLAPVHLDITAVPGAGNLLGNLVCAIAGLLDGDGPLTGIAVLLNRLLSGLGL